MNLAEFGGTILRACRDLAADLHQWARRLGRSQAVFLVAAATLAAGIGVAGAAFAVVDAVLLRPLPYAEPGRLAVVWELAGGEQAMLTIREYLDLRARLRSFSDFAALMSMSFDAPGRCTLTDGAVTESAPCACVTWNFFRTLGVRPHLGRDFVEPEESASVAPALLLSYALWQRRFAGDPAVIGKRMKVDGGEATVIGVLPRGLMLPGGTGIWLPPGFDEKAQKNPFRLLRAVGRLRPGVTHPQARDEIQALVAGWPARSARWGAQVMSLKEVLNRDIRFGLLAMQGAAIVLLAIASFNAANLLLLLAANRRKEIAIRAAAGASPGRLLRLFLAESLALAGLAAAAGTGLAFAALRILAPLSPASLLRAGEASLDWRSLSSIVLVSLAAAVAAGAPPALSVWRLRLRDALAQTAVSRRRAVSRASTACAVAGLALALPLSLSAGLILRSFQKLSQTDPGFRAQGVLVFHLVGAPEPANCASCDSRQRTLTLRERVRALPGAEAVANSEAVPLEGFRTDWRFALEPASLRDPARLHSALWNGVSEDYFRVLGIPLRRGREFQPSSDRRRQNVIVNEELARRCFPGQDALGRTLFHESGRPFQIVGVAGNVRSERLELAAQPEVYLYGGGISLSVRYRGDPAALQRAVRDLLQSEGGGLILAETTPLERFLNNGTARLRLWTVLLGALTGCSLCLAAAGVYALVACSTRRRVAEFGLRMALGARRTDIFLLVLRDTLRLAGAGILLGVLGAAAASSLVSHLLFEVRPWDPPAAAASVLALTLVSLAASLPAARSASRVEPRQALSAE